jgi:hypothetical protein
LILAQGDEFRNQTCLLAHVTLSHLPRTGQADLHGDIRTLMGDLAWLNSEGYLVGFKIAKPNFHMVLLGDYADRWSLWR